MKSEVGICTDCLMYFTLLYTAIHKYQLTDVDLTLFTKSLELNSRRAALQERTNTKNNKVQFLILKSLVTVKLSN